MALFIFAIYFSTSLAVIMSGVLGALWLLSGQFKHLPGILKKYPVAAWALALFGLFYCRLKLWQRYNRRSIFYGNEIQGVIFHCILFSFSDR